MIKFKTIMATSAHLRCLS